jgi:hypothetical protein
MNPEKVTPTCRYGHGPLTLVDRMHKYNANFGLVMFIDALTDGPAYLNGLNFYVCSKCGYVELFDSSAQQTIDNMEKPHG